jgi:hypothetical protein
MTAVIRLAEEITTSEKSGLPLSITLGVSVFLSFAILLFLVTRLNPDR